MIEILATGSGISLQDAGRQGWRRFGVPSGGAMDFRSMERANSLIGNAPDACVLEITLLGARLRVIEDCWLAIAGADFCTRFQSDSAMPFRAGDVLEFDQKSAGLFSYVAMPGGFDSPRWLGSRSTDLRNGMGRSLKKNDRLVAAHSEVNVLPAGVGRRIAVEPLDHIPKGNAHFSLYPGPQYEAFLEASRNALVERDWTLSTRSDRTGYRLEGEPIEVPQSIASEPVLPGSFQVPGNGKPIITMNDGPTVGGYAKIAVVGQGDLDRLAQCAPGAKLSFSWIR